MPLTPLVAEWTDTYGQQHKVTTRPTNMDTPETLAARHADMVELMQQAFPPE